MNTLITSSAAPAIVFDRESQGKEQRRVVIETDTMGARKICIFAKATVAGDPASSKLDQLVQVSAHFKTSELHSDSQFSEAQQILKTKALQLQEKYKKDDQNKKLQKLQVVLENLGLAELPSEFLISKQEQQEIEAVVSSLTGLAIKSPSQSSSPITSPTVSPEKQEGLRESKETDVFFKYIKKNKTVAQITADFSKNDSPITALQVELDALNFKGSTLTQNPDANLMVQYLYEQGKISDEYRQTLMLYIAALQTFGSQPFNGKETMFFKALDVDYITQICPYYSLLFDKYLEEVATKVGKIKPLDAISFSKERIKEKIAKLPIAERGVIAVEMPDMLTKVNLERLDPDYSPFPKQITSCFQFAARKDFFIFCVLCEQKKALFPSISILNVILGEINPDFDQRLTPMLGSISSMTMCCDLLVKGSRPMSVHHCQVKSNPRHVENIFDDPFTIALHDLSHLQENAGVEKNIYHFIKNQLFPLVVSFNSWVKGVTWLDEYSLSLLTDILFWPDDNINKLIDHIFRIAYYNNNRSVFLLSLIIGSNNQCYLLDEFCKERGIGKRRIKKIVNNFDKKELSSWTSSDFEYVKHQLSNSTPNSASAYFIG